MECFENLMCWVNINFTIVVKLHLFRSLQMELSRKIQEVDSCYSMKLISIQVDRKYPITRAERFATRFGAEIVLAMRDKPDRIPEVVMPKIIYSAF